MGWIDAVKERIRRSEGLVLPKAKPCPKGFLTIGYGYNLEAHGYSKADAAKVEWAFDQAEAMLDQAVKTAGRSVRSSIPSASALDDLRYGVLVEMAYIMGIGGLLAFKNALASVSRDDWDAAAAGILHSKFAADVGDYAPDSDKGRKYGRPGRAWELAYIMRTGEPWRAGE